MTDGTGATRKLARHASTLRYEDLPPEAIEQAKLAILDTIGVTIAGVATPTGQAVCRVAEDLGGRPSASVIGARSLRGS